MELRTGLLFIRVWAKERMVQMPRNIDGRVIESVGFTVCCFMVSEKVEGKIMLRVRGLLSRDLSPCLI